MIYQLGLCIITNTMTGPAMDADPARGHIRKQSEKHSSTAYITCWCGCRFDPISVLTPIHGTKDIHLGPHTEKTKYTSKISLEEGHRNNSSRWWEEGSKWFAGTQGVPYLPRGVLVQLQTTPDFLRLRRTREF